MTAALSLDQRRPDRAEQLEHLRRKIAAVSGKVGGGRRGAAPAVDPLPASESLLPMPEIPGRTAPAPLPRGTVAVLSGARSLPLSMVAAVTAEGGHAAIVGQPDVGLLAAMEMGADLSRIAVIPEPGSRSGRGGRGADGRHGPGGARAGWAVGARRAGPGRSWPGRGRRAAHCWSPTVTGRGRPPGWMPGSAATRSPGGAGARDAVGSAGCGWPCVPGAGPSARFAR